MATVIFAGRCGEDERSKQAHNPILFLLSARRPTDQALRSRARDRERRCRAGSPTEISFNATLMKELRMIALMRQLADPGSGEGGRWAKLRL